MAGFGKKNANKHMNAKKKKAFNILGIIYSTSLTIIVISSFLFFLLALFFNQKSSQDELKYEKIHRIFKYAPQKLLEKFK